MSCENRTGEVFMFPYPRLNLPDFPTPIVPPMTCTDETELSVGSALSTNPMKQLDHNVTSYAVIHYQLDIPKQSIVSLAVVAHSFGGKSLSRKTVSEIAVNAIVEKFSRSNSADVKTLFIEGFGSAGQRILQYNSHKRPTDQSVAVCSAIFIMNHHLYLASLGHCRVFLLRSGEVKQISTPHTLMEYLVEHGLRKPEERSLAPDGPPSFYWLGGEAPYPDFRLRLSSNETPEQSAANQGLELHSGDQILLCVASVYGVGYLTSERLKEIADRLLKHSHPQQAVDEFIASERRTGNLSELTMILLKIP